MVKPIILVLTLKRRRSLETKKTIGKNYSPEQGVYVPIKDLVEGTWGRGDTSHAKEWADV